MTLWRKILLLLLAAALMLPALPSIAEVRSNVLRTIEVSNTPIDIEVSLNGQRIYVLNDQGALLIYDMNGELLESMKVGREVTQLKVSARDDLLYLLNPKAKTVQVLDLTFIYKINTKGSPIKGPADAPVTIAVFSDFQCPYCARIGGVLEAVLKQFPGKVNVAFKHFPLPNHRYSTMAAQASVAAQEQGKFWEYHDLVFKNFRSLTPEKLDEFAKALNLDLDAFNKVRVAPETVAKVNRDRAEGENVGVQGTPSVFVNGQLVRPANFEGIKDSVEKALRALK